MAHYKMTASSRVGCVRTNNEDMLLVGENLLRNGKMSYEYDTEQTGRFLVALADGMGGHNCGEVASEDVLSNLRYYFNDLPTNLSPEEFNEAIYDWLKSVCLMINSKGQHDPTFRDMGTTLVALAYYGNDYYWMNCGDSRLYLLHQGGLRQLTVDHSLSNLLGSTRHSSQIVNCIGGGSQDSYIDIVRCTEQVGEGDILMLCSDGLTDMVSDDEIRRMLIEGFDADALCQAAEDAGGHDNVSVTLIQVEKL